ncbi:MAG: hypothetical protein LBC74_12545 [Planctomycetaceae bacterium]|jgi:mono/diheme cytochrome c family protein|nr:hypothetical protein [Planctomycetaceae bacterium]
MKRIFKLSTLKFSLPFVGFSFDESALTFLCRRILMNIQCIFVLFVVFGMICHADNINVTKNNNNSSATISSQPSTNNTAVNTNNNSDELRIETPLLFVKRHNYLGLHIYDTFYKWRPGGGIYVLENPADPPEKHRIRPVIDPTTPQTLGEGMYSHPDLSWDAKRILFCFKGSSNDGTSIYEIGVDGKGLRKITDCKSNFCNKYQGVGRGNHDFMPAYLPDGRIVFTSTRYSGLVPCANNGVNILHVMNADGSNIHPISVNNVNEFDPSIMPDGRILFGRWEYIDKNALTQQSAWSVFPDGTNETALFANNLVFPEATLQLRSVPNVPYLICSTFAKHNGPPRGSIAMIDLRKGKDEIAAITNFEHPKNPTYDHGESCDPFPLSENLVVYSGQFARGQKNSIMLINRNGNRTVLISDPRIDLHNPIPIEPRPIPPIISDQTDNSKTEGDFFVQDVYAGLPNVPRGSIKWLRVIEETSRISPSPGPTILNQTFLVSAALAFSSKNYLGIVPVEKDGSAFFSVPSGKAVYFQLLDENYKLVRSMRTFIQAVPGTTRSCFGCHEYIVPAKESARKGTGEVRRLKPESWGSGPIDYPSMIQPILNRNCVSCHGGEKGIAAGLDLTGGWTEYFNNSYENLVSRREVVYSSPLIGGIDCMNGTANWSAQIFGTYEHGSGKAPLADVVVSGHKKRFPNMTQTERELMLAWIDTNGLYYGTWNYTKNGYTIPQWQKLKSDLINVMKEAGCASCHADEKGNIRRFEPDWINLEKPEWSRILRAPLPDVTSVTSNKDKISANKKSNGSSEQNLGLGFCRAGKVDQNWRRLLMPTNSSYEHAVRELNRFPRQIWRNWDKDVSKTGEPVISFASTSDPYYQKMLRLIDSARYEILNNPRIDMPGAISIGGQFRQIIPTPLPNRQIGFTVKTNPDSSVLLQWEQSAETYGLTFNIYRNNNLIATTTAFKWIDIEAEIGRNKYSLIPESNGKKGLPVRVEINVPKAELSTKVESLVAEPSTGSVKLYWRNQFDNVTYSVSYEVWRQEVTPNAQWNNLTQNNPVKSLSFNDRSVKADKIYRYKIRPVFLRGEFGDYSNEVEAYVKAIPRITVFESTLQNSISAKLANSSIVKGDLRGDAKLTMESLEIPSRGGLIFPNREEYNAEEQIEVDFWVQINELSQMPVLVSFGQWNVSGWFVQFLTGRLRWHCNGVDCDGGTIVVGKWTHLVCQYDGETLRIVQDGKKVAEKQANSRQTPNWKGKLIIGNYTDEANPQYQLKGCIKDIKITNYIKEN